MTMISPIFANLSDFEHSLVHITGFFFVIFVIILLWFFAAMMGTFFKKFVKVAPAKAVPAAPVAASSGEDDETVAVIAAALAMITHQKYRIVSIKGTNPDWSREGRREHFASHKIR